MSTFRIKAQFRLLSSEEGGRKTPIATNYRPDWDLGHVQDGMRMLNCGQLFFRDGIENIYPGEEGPVEIEPLTPEYWRGLEPGTLIGAYEGPNLVGQAITESVVVISDDSDVAEAVKQMQALSEVIPAKKVSVSPQTLRTLEGLIRLETPVVPKMAFFLVPDHSVEEFATAVMSAEEEVPNVDLSIERYVRMGALPKNLQTEVRKALGILSLS